MHLIKRTLQAACVALTFAVATTMMTSEASAQVVHVGPHGGGDHWGGGSVHWGGHNQASCESHGRGASVSHWFSNQGGESRDT